MSGTSPRFDVGGGIRQGCPALPYLFLLVAQRLANHIKSSSVKGIDLMGREVVVTQLADYTTLFLKDENQISALDEINEFSEASGLCLNINKCELMSIKECSKSSICGIPIKNEVTYLGIIITKDPQKQTSLNLIPVIQKTQKSKTSGSYGISHSQREF